MNETVVLVHGLWMNGLDMSLLRCRLDRAGYNTQRFTYASVRRSPVKNARSLQTRVAGIRADRLHFVGHSLGGLVIQHLFHLYPDQPPGCVVALGTPYRESAAAGQLQRTRAGRWLLGKSVMNGLLGPLPPWCGTRPLGVIAGSMRAGLGTIIRGIPQPSDGTVAVAETRTDDMTDHITLPVSHFGLLLSSRVADQVQYFLRNGHFDHAAL